MELEQIDRMGLDLVRDATLRVPMADALEDLGIKWKDWLVSSETLRRLAECMELMETHVPRVGFEHDPEGVPRPQTVAWLTALGFHEDDLLTLMTHGAGMALYTRICQAFSVPPVAVQVYEERRSSLASPYATLAWRPPSLQLASQILSEAVRDERHDKWQAILEQRYSPHFPIVLNQDAVHDAVQRWFPQASHYRIRVGHLPWRAAQLFG